MDEPKITHWDGRGNALMIYDDGTVKMQTAKTWGRKPIDGWVAEIEGLRADRDRIAAYAERLKDRIGWLEDGMRQIAAIEDRYNGGDWDEIEEARSIANRLLGQRVEGEIRNG